VTDTFGSAARTTIVSFSFKDFKVETPAGIVIHPGVPSTAIVTVSAINQYYESVHLIALASQGLNATISPATITGSGTATLTVASSIAGNYTVTVTGTSGGLTHSMTPKVATPIYAKFSTSSGVIEVELYQNLAPKTVINFVKLANQGFYSNLVWHRIVKGFVIQTGDPNTRGGGGDRSTWGSGGSSQTVPLEIDSSLHNNAGYLGMARGSDVNSASSQFYINLANNNSLDGKYAVFGKVIAGMDIALAIGNVPVDSNSQPISLVYLTSVTISTTP
jgi:cyclophilin family peptidyl-prolyl cis-trans isomerase